MAEQPTGQNKVYPQAFPPAHGGDGMDLRDYFAAKAMPLAWRLFLNPETVDFCHIAKEAYEMADAMLKAREVTP